MQMVREMCSSGGGDGIKTGIKKKNLFRKFKLRQAASGDVRVLVLFSNQRVRETSQENCNSQ